MKKTILATITAASLLASFAHTATAGYTITSIGNSTFITGTGGNYGSRTTCTRIGTTIFCN